MRKVARSKIRNNIVIASAVRDLKEVEGRLSDADKEGISAALRLPTCPHFPTMQASVKLKVGVRELFSDKIVADAPYRHAPL